MRVHITCPQLSGLVMSGGSDAKSETAFTADNFNIEASGGSDVKLSLTANSLTVVASAGSDIDVSGRVERQRVNVSGGSDYRAFGLNSTTADVQASGSNVSVTVNGELTSNASGGSDVRYQGKGRVASSRASGSSGVRRVK